MSAPTSSLDEIGEVELRRGDQRARVWRRGATLRTYTVGSREVIVPFSPGQLSLGMHGAVLAPWPNRLDAGRFQFGGESFQVTVNEPERNNAIHGLVWDRDWDLVEHTDAQVMFGVELPATDYGFALHLTLTYALSDGGLWVRCTARNLDQRSAPFGVGFHPWLSPGAAGVDDCQLQVDAERWLRPNDRLLPIEATDIPAQFDFRVARRLGETVIDDAFTAATGPDGYSQVDLISPDGFTATVRSELGLPFWQICTGDFDELGPLRRSGVAAEPMSCPANALASGDHLISIAPGEEHTVEFSLRLRANS